MHRDPSSPEQVAKRLLALREALGLTKAEFADAIGCDRSSYTKIEKATKPMLPPMAFRIYELYGADMNYLYLGQLGGVPVGLSKKLIKALSGLTE
jgi:transcriptional regulator with XRE-family HTH domain